MVNPSGSYLMLSQEELEMEFILYLIVSAHAGTGTSVAAISVTQVGTFSTAPACIDAVKASSGLLNAIDNPNLKPYVNYICVKYK